MADEIHILSASATVESFAGMVMLRFNCKDDAEAEALFDRIMSASLDGTGIAFKFVKARG